MITFENGPAHGKTLLLRRAPRFLRVVLSNTDAIDALDQLDDRPAANEKIFAYEIVGKAQRVHLLMNPRRNSGWYVMARYRYIEEQPHDPEMRDQARWEFACQQLAATRKEIAE